MEEETKKVKSSAPADEHYNMRIGKLEDGRVAIARSHSKEGRPTLEIYNPMDKTSIQMVYTEKKETHVND